jgi:BlaI family penicillinase repressor
MEELTHSEETIMRVLWDLGEGVVHDIIDKLPEPRPPYTTVSSTVRSLEKKGYIQHKAFGKTYLYYPSITKETYASKTFHNLVQHYFAGSPKNVVSFIVQEKSLKPGEVEELKQLIDSYYKSKS